MVRAVALTVSAFLVFTSCALLPSPEDDSGSRVTDIETFVERLADQIEMHDWQSILASADPTLYRTQVVDLEIPEPQFVADLLGLGNLIDESSADSWAELERITMVTLMRAGSPEPPFTITGGAVLEGGETVPVTASAIQVQGRFVLTRRSE